MPRRFRAAVTVLFLLAAACSARGFPLEAATLPPTQPPFTPPPPVVMSDEEIRELIELRGDGIGAFRFGDPVDSVVPSLISALGQPDEDIGTDCVTGPDRFVRWAELTVGFDDIAFVTWIVGSHYPPGGRPPLRPSTSAGVMLDDPPSALRRGDATLVRRDDGPGDAYTVTIPVEGELSAYVEGKPRRIVGLHGGAPCTSG